MTEILEQDNLIELTADIVSAYISNNTISAGFNEGMILLDDSLLQLHKEGVLHTADVLSRLNDPEKARLVMKG